MTRAEQETVFRYAAAEDVVSVFTAYPPVMNKFKRLGYMPYKTSTRQGEAVGWFYRIPLGEFRWRAGKRAKREVSAAVRQAAVERFAKARVARFPSEESGAPR